MAGIWAIPKNIIVVDDRAAGFIVIQTGHLLFLGTEMVAVSMKQMGVSRLVEVRD